MQKVTIGIIGCGVISSIYMKNIPSFQHLALKACADLDMDKAQAQADRFQIPKCYTVEEMLADNEIDLIINLTIPQAHAEICLRALEANKHVYVEKPLAVTRKEGKEILKTAQMKNLRVGSAPDTFLGAGIQTAVQLIESGEIGQPIGASAFMINRGTEHWHPDPAFFYAKGGGPMFDMGPYYLTALIALFGPIKQLAGMAKISYPERTIGSEPKAGEKIPVEVATHISGTLEFAAGPVATLTTSFDAFGGTTLPNMEVYGSKGTLLVPDPNTFGGPVKIRRTDEEHFQEVPLDERAYINDRGLGVADMAYALLKEEEHRAHGDLAYHVLEAMHGFHDSSDTGAFYRMKSTCTKPKPFSYRPSL